MNETETRLNLLIDQAAAKAGSYYKLAKTIDYAESAVHNWRAGKPCPIEAQALMADIAGLNAEEVTLYAIIERAAEKNPKRGEALERVLGKAFARMTVSASCAMFVSAIWASKNLHTMYIM